MMTSAKGFDNRHGRQTCRPCSTHQLQQQGFSLVILMMRSEQYLITSKLVFKRLVTRFTRSLFGTLTRAWISINMNTLVCNIKLQTDPGAMPVPVISFGLQSVMDMNGANRQSGRMA